jgi:spermidine synthase
VLLVLLLASGGAALIYEIVWFELMQLVVGSSAVSLGMLLAAFMAGTCLGSLGFSRYAGASRHPLMAYARLEIGIAVLGVAVLLMMPLVSRAYIASVAAGWSGSLARAIVGAICLLPPTMLMGATLPAASRWLELSSADSSWLALAYSANTAGAVAGCLAAGFYLLPTYDGELATYLAAGLNLFSAAGAFLLVRFTDPIRPSSSTLGDEAGRRRNGWVYVAAAISGGSALAAEVLWTRSLSLLLGATVYTFSLVLAVFLSSIALGSVLASRILRRGVAPAIALGLCQLLLVPAISWTCAILNLSLPYWPVNPSLSNSPWILIQIDLLRCLWALAPPAILWGAALPFALAAAGDGGPVPAGVVGRVLAANTAGAIVGATAASLVIVPQFGTRAGEQALLIGCVAAALCALVPAIRRARAWRATVPSAAAVTAAVALVFWAASLLPDQPAHLVAYGRYMATWIDRVKIVYVGEGQNASVAVSEFSDGVRNFHVSGKVEASSQPQDMRLQRMLAHLPGLAHDDPRAVLVVGLGAGVTAGSFLLYPDISRIVIAEIEPLIPTAIAPYFSAQNNDVVNDPKATVVYDDGRHFLQTTREQFDIITSDPIHPWVKGSASLYTKEYFELVKSRLKPGGIVSQWLPLYESDSDAVKMVIATILEVFPHATVWGNAHGQNAVDVVLVARNENVPFDADRAAARLTQPAFSGVRGALEEVGFGSAADLLSTFSGRGEDLRPWLAGVEVNRDRNLRLQYVAGRESTVYASRRIHDEMLAYRRFSDDVFAASAGMKEALTASATERARGRLPALQSRHE